MLRERTHDLHREAERGGFIALLIRGRATREGYALFLRNLVPVYDAMEAALEAALEATSDAVLDRGAEASVRAFADRGLRRGGALRADLAALAGPDWATRHPVLPAAASYAGSVARAGRDLRLIAHASVRYLGDLSGGQILKPILARSLGLGEAALAFYDFPALLQPALAKAAMRDALDGLDPAAAEQVAAEAMAAFRHMIALSLAVAERHPAEP